MRKWFVFAALIGGLVACGEAPDELGPYVNKVKDFQSYHKIFAQYQEYLQTDGMANKTNDLREQIENYKKDLETVPEIDSKHIRSAHNALIRTLDGTLIKLVQPDFPTYVPSARKQLKLIREKVTIYNNNLKKLWVEAGKTESFPLAFPE
ncbi:MAG: hypothetical protein GKR89_27755 [Candidatus Latescibacteria bacterium]|nr:hypothetical protein [Candidatus Latescibacterota bacterium]